MTAATLTRPAAAPSRATGRPRRTPRRAYQPKQHDPGQPIRYGTDQDARTGVVWSAGPVASSLWVLPDDDPANPVAVHLYRPRHGEPQATAITSYPASWQRDTIRRCDAVRAAGRVFLCTETVTRRSWEHRPGTTETVTRFPFHVEGCPVAGPDREYMTAARTGIYGAVAWIVDRLLSGNAGQPLSDLCPVCIYLTEEG